MKKTILTLLVCISALALWACTGCFADQSNGSPDSGASCAFGLSCEARGGNAYSEDPEGYYSAGTEISVHAVPSEGSAFHCWTVGGYLAEGGTAVNYARDFSFPLTEDTRLYANFRGRDSALVLYHANGGTVLKNGDGTALSEGDPDDVCWDDFSLAYYLYPNALAEMGYFRRDGYTLIGYSTEPDGGGEFYNVGGKIFEETDSVIELWCVWSKQSPAEDFDFEKEPASGTWYITAYHGSDEDVSLPSAYNGARVSGLSAGAFSGNDVMRTLVIPSTFTDLKDYSVYGCTSLEKLWLFDSLNYVSDNTFSGDTALSTVYFGAATPPVYCNWFNNHTKKVEIMNYWKDAGRPKMIILGGSSTNYAVDSEQLESLLDRDYLVLNCGTNGANLFNMTSEWAMRFLNEGDFLLQIVEYSAWQLGGVICRWESWRSFESCYNVFSWVDASRYYSFFDAFHDYLDTRRSQTPAAYEDYVSNLAPYGYYNTHGTLNIITQPNGSPSFWQGRRIFFCDYWLYDFMVDNCNAQYAKLRDMGVDYAMAFTPLNRNSLYDTQTDQGIDDFEYYLDHVLDIPVVGHLRENLADPEILFDDDYHLAAPARAEYTERLARDLNAYFGDPDSFRGELMPNGYTSEAIIAAMAGADGAQAGA